MQTILFSTDASPPGRAVMMLIDILGLKVKLKELNPVLREQDTYEFKKKNPMRTIPILDEGDYCLADSHAILLYLFDKHAKPEHSAFYPPNKRIRATINQRLFFDCGILFPRLRAVMAPTYGGRLTELTKYMKVNIDDAYSMLEDYLAESIYLADNVPTIADISTISTVSSLNGVHPINELRFQNLTKWFKNMNGKDYVKRINQPGCELHVHGLKAMMEHNKNNKQSKL